MKKFFGFLMALAVGFLAMTAPALAQVEVYELERPHTQIIFVADHLGFSHSYGKFTDFTGEITFDRTHPEKSSVQTVIKTASLDLNDKTWNEHVAGEKLFNAAQFPEMTFKSTKVEVTGEKTGKITGDLTLHGVTKPVTLDVTLNNVGKNPFNSKPTAGFSAVGTVKRSDFGMDYGIPAVGDEVKIIIEVESLLKGDGEQDR